MSSVGTFSSKCRWRPLLRSFQEKTEKKKTPAADAVVVKTNAPTTVYASPGNTTIVVKDRKGNIRDVDEYNRRYDSKDYDFSQENDTLYIDEKEDDGLDGEWVNGFDGSEDDYVIENFAFMGPPLKN